MTKPLRWLKILGYACDCHVCPLQQDLSKTAPLPVVRKIVTRAEAKQETKCDSCSQLAMHQLVIIGGTAQRGERQAEASTR